MKNKALILILILAAFLRFWQLGQSPPSPDWDEAALGYNAYSIMKTGRDEYGEFLPLVLRSFDDYKPAIFVYLVIPAIKLFGLNTFAVRFPAALLGTLAVYLTFLLVQEFFAKSRLKIPLALLASFLLAISPWHLQFSRVAFESNIGVLVNILIVLFFLKGLKKPRLLLLSALFAGLNLYVYQAEKVFTPLLVLALVLIFWRRVFRLRWQQIIFAIIVGLITITPFIYQVFTTPEIFSRAKGTSFAADVTPFLARTVEKIIRDQERGDYLGLVLDNRRITYLKAFLNGYLAHFDFNWLFLSGDEARHHAPGMGQFYLWELPFLLWGFYALIFSRFSLRTKKIIWAWFLLAPIPAAFASGTPHGVRTLRFLPMIQIFVALGLVSFWQWGRKKPKFVRKILFLALTVFFIFNLAYFLNQYFVQQNYFHSQFWQYGYQPAIQTVKEIENDYQQVIVSNEPHLDQSYMFFLFYLQYDPEAYQASGGTVSGGFAEAHQGFSKYTFRPIDWKNEEKEAEILYVGRPDDFSPEAKVIKTVNFLDGQPAIKIVAGS